MISSAQRLASFSDSCVKEEANAPVEEQRVPGGKEDVPVRHPGPYNGHAQRPDCEHREAPVPWTAWFATRQRRPSLSRSVSTSPNRVGTDRLARDLPPVFGDHFRLYWFCAEIHAVAEVACCSRETPTSGP
jgi:hypothetical protein